MPLQKARIMELSADLRREMRLKRIKWGVLLFWGWPAILILAAVVLPRDESNAIAFPILVLMCIWFLLSVVALVFISTEHGDGLVRSQTKQHISVG